MAIKGIGVDIEDISRFRNTPFEQNKAFYQRLFTKKELDYCFSKSNPYQHLAARFCAKEAFIKASNIDFKGKVPNYQIIQVVMENSKPCIKYKNKKHLLSLSHDKDKAIGFVIVQ
ncbi:holo-ACP synthase [Candidatus Woesearchaeota archaeon]|nr:holo-ACP synthase [Candidatus Woesearchaeota archaeon]